MRAKVIEARAEFGVAYFAALDDPDLRWPAWLVEHRSSLRGALSDAALPMELERELSIVALTLRNLIPRAHPPTNKEVRKDVARIANAIRRERALLEPPDLPYEIEARLPVGFHSVEHPDGDMECVFEASPIDEIRDQLDRLLQYVEEIELPPAAQHGPRISRVTTAVWVVVKLASEHKPDIGRPALTQLARAVLEPAVNNVGGPDGARVDWHDQVTRALRELNCPAIS